MTEKNMTGGGEESEDRNDQTQGQGAVVDPQINSLLFQRLPQEMRNHIYRSLFSCTRILFKNEGCTLVPAPNSHALLRVCRRAKLEIGNSWLNHVLFSFPNGEAMLRKLSKLPADTLSQIRHIRVTGGDVYVLLDPDVYSPVSVLKFLPGLRLDQLTVLDYRSKHQSYEALNRLILKSNGWKTLRYICQGSGMLGFSSEPTKDMRECEPKYWRKPQPMHWQMIMEGRDGVASNPSVTIYRGKEKLEFGCLSTVLDPSKRVKFVQTSWEGPNSKPGVFSRDPELMTKPEIWKEMLVIVKRGSGVDYEQKKDSPFAEGDPDLRRKYPGMTWSQINALVFDYEHILDNMVETTPVTSIRYVDFVDDYKDVDEYRVFRYLWYEYDK